MDYNLLNEFIRHVDRGHKVLFKTDHLGGVHIKIMYGPFNSLSFRRKTDQLTFKAIREQLPSRISIRELADQ